MAEFDTVAIIGVGLIGGSIGLAVRERKLARQVIGIGRDEAKLANAFRLGAIDAHTTTLAHGVEKAQLVIVCTPVDRVADFVVQAGGVSANRTLITDAGSTKAEIVANQWKLSPRVGSPRWAATSSAAIHSPADHRTGLEARPGRSVRRPHSDCDAHRAIDIGPRSLEDRATSGKRSAPTSVR